MDMSDANLRSKLIRLAHEKPELRSTLLPLLRERKVAGADDAKKILDLFKKNFKYVSVRGHGSSRDVVFEFSIENGLFDRNVAAFAQALGVDPKKVTLY